MGRLTRFLGLSFGDDARLLTAAIVLLIARLGLFVVSFDRFRRLLLALAAGSSRVVPGSPTPARVAWAVDTADRHVPGDRTCLMRSLTTETLLRLYDLDSAVDHRIGVDKTRSGEFEAHSWIEHGDTILIGDLEDLSRYRPLPPLDGDDEQ